jgi:hypothetical protein
MKWPSYSVSPTIALGFLLYSVMIGVFFGLRATAMAADPCWYVDACSPDLKCRQTKEGIYQTVSPMGLQLHQSGPIIEETCQRLTWTNSTCTQGKTEDDYTGKTCGQNYP